MSKKGQPVSLYQESSVPYVILSNGVLLCFQNNYNEQVTKLNEDFNIFFTAPNNLLIHESGNYSFRTFPVTIPFDNVFVVNNTKPIRTVAEKTSIESKTVSIIRNSCLRKKRGAALREILDDFESYDRNFLLINETNPYLEEVPNISVLLHKNSDWGRTCAFIAHELCEDNDRSSCWTRKVPDLEIYCYGLKDTSNLDTISICFESMGINTELNWEC